MKRPTVAAQAAVAVVCVVLASACGSTVPVPTAASPVASGAAAAAAGGGLSIPTTQNGSPTGSNGAITAPIIPGGTTSGTSSSGSTSTGSSSTGGGNTSSSSGGGPSAPSASVPGVTATTIYIGAYYIKNEAAANAAVGAGGAGGGDARDAYRVVIKQINAEGGIAGRKVVPIFGSEDATSSTPIDQQRQANCAKWTQDNKVFVILAGGNSIYEECAKKAGAAEIVSNLTGSTSLPGTFRQYPNYVEIVGMNLVRMGSITVNGLSTQGYFDKGAKIGMLTWDEPTYREALQKGYLPALANHGLRLATAPVSLTPPQTYQDLATVSAQVNSAVLKFESIGIDHVMMVDGAAGVCGVGCIGFEFMQRAKAQHYYPRYGMNDNNAPAAGYDAGFYPADELSNSLAVGWDDLDKSYDRGWHVNATREQCYALMRKHGVDLSSVNAQAAALEACDELAFLKLAVSRMGSAPLTPQNLIAGVNAIGTSFASTQTYGTSFSASQHDGVNLVRNYKWVDSCKCFQYTSPAYRP